MENIIKAAVDRGASDIHIKAGDVFRARIDGELRPLTKQRLTPDQTKAIAVRLLPTDAAREMVDALRDFDCTWGAPGIGRFRVNILRQRSSFMIVMRTIPFDVPTIENLGLPAILTTIAESAAGIVLVTGVSGSGKSSTVAALVHHINTTANRHIVTLESPIEFLHRDLKSSVTQREVGVDTASFSAGLQASLRQDPDVIVIEELRDREVADVAIKAAETGRLVVSTLHTPDATSTVARLASMYPSGEQEVARVRLADALHAVVSQQLLARLDDEGRCAAMEVLIASQPIRDTLRDRARAGDIYRLISDGKEEHGTQTFEQHLVELVESKKVSFETARVASRSPEEFDLLSGVMSEWGTLDKLEERRSGRRDRRRGVKDRRSSRPKPN